MAYIWDIYGISYMNPLLKPDYHTVRVMGTQYCLSAYLADIQSGAEMTTGTVRSVPVVLVELDM
jgi:hypothetical protein